MQALKLDMWGTILLVGRDAYMTNLFIKGNITKAFWVMLGCAFIIVSVGMAWSLVVRGFASVSLAPKKPLHSLMQAGASYSIDPNAPKPPSAGPTP
jgi:energy-converting hydrogenase Eha subunit G